MAQIEIKKVENAKDLLRFIQFPMDLYKDNPNYVPSLISEEKNIWNPAENPALAYSEAEQYIAYKNQKVVGRVAAIFNKKEQQELGISKIRFGWLDFVEDIEVADALIQKVVEFAKKRNITKIEGPMGFTNLDKAGMLVLGFDKLATMIGLYNDAYYPQYLENLGFKKEKEWVEFEIQFPDFLPEKITKFSKLISEKYGLKVIEFGSKKDILPLVFPMFQLLDETYKHLSTYTPITEEQIQTYKEKYFPFIDKDYLICIQNREKELIAFAITMPSYSQALRKAKGRLFPFGWYHFYRAGKKNNRANFYLIGIHPDYQRRGVTAIVFEEIFKRFKRKGIKFLETNPELEENKNIQLLWQDYHPLNHKRRRTYCMEIKK